MRSDIQNEYIILQIQGNPNMPIFSHQNPQFQIKILDFAYTSEPLINNALPLKFSRLKFILFTLACILTFGFVWLIARWSPKKKAILLYSVSNINEATHFLIEQEDDVHTSIVDRANRLDIKRKSSVVSFSYHDRNFLYHEEKDVFLPIRYEDLGMQLDRLKKGKFQAYSRRSRKKLLQYYGINQIVLNVQNSLEVFIEQMLTPYEVFQMYAIILWISEQYYLFPIILLIYSIYTYWQTSKQIVKNQKKLAEKSHFNSACKVITKQKSGKGLDIQQANDSQDYTIVDEIHLDEMLSNRNERNQKILEEVQQKNSGFLSSNFSDKQQIELSGQSKHTIQVTSIESKQILPGDIIILKEGDIVPCDCVLIYGQAIVDESFISGMNYLIRKTQIHSYQYSKNLEKTFLLYFGTKIVKAKRTKDWSDHEQKQQIPFANHNPYLLKDLIEANQIACIVTQTNYNTQRGKYLRQIRYQKKPQDNFTRESIYFIYIILIITTFVFLILVPFIHKYKSGGAMLYLFIDLIATSIPITLPTALSVGINFAQRRLVKNGIHSTLPSNILSGGRANTIVLDSSKVLSKNYKVSSIVVGVKGKSIGNTYSDLDQFLDISNNETLSQSFLEDPERKKNQKDSINQCGKMLIRAFATCHSLQMYNNQLSGSAEQRHLYQFSKSKFLENDKHECLGYNLKVKQRIYFKEKHKKIAVLVQISEKQEKRKALSLEMREQGFDKQNKMIETDIEKELSDNYIFIKGPAQNIMKICKQGTYPYNHHDYVVDLAEKGFKTLCYAYKKVPQKFNSDKNIEFLNQNFIFCGFALLQTEKQRDMIDTISDLKKSKMQIILISEQSQLVTSSLAINNGLCTKNQLILCRMHHGKILCTGHVQWESQGQGEDLREFVMQSDSLIRNSYLSLNAKLYQQLYMKKDQNINQNIFKKAIVFNEIENRHSRNIYLQLQKRERVTFAVGSGANVSECANLSIELERGQCSMLSSFYTNQSSMQCVTKCLIICRAALATNFHCSSMMILFSMIQFSTVSILYFYYQNLSDFQMIYEDLIVTFPIFVTINMTSPVSKLSKQLPPKSFFAPRALASMVGQFFIQLLTQIIFITYVASLQFIKPEMQAAEEQFKKSSNFSSTNLTLAAFILTNYLYLGIVLSTSVSKPFRKPFYTNIYYTLTLVLLWLYNTAIVLLPEVVPQRLRRDNLSQEVEEILVLAMLLGNLIMIVMYIYQNCLVWLGNFFIKVRAPRSNQSQIQLLDIK